MSNNYYEPRNLADFPNITEYASEQGKKFFEYYTQATGPGVVTVTGQALIPLPWRPFTLSLFIDACTDKCLSLGVSSDEMMEAVHVGAPMTAGDLLAHSTQMRKIIKKKEM